LLFGVVLGVLECAARGSVAICDTCGDTRRAAGFVESPGLVRVLVAGTDDVDSTAADNVDCAVEAPFDDGAVCVVCAVVAVAVVVSVTVVSVVATVVAAMAVLSVDAVVAIEAVLAVDAVVVVAVATAVVVINVVDTEAVVCVFGAAGNPP